MASAGGGAASAFEYIFTSYSERILTYSKDRLYAIAGLEHRLKDFYRTESSYGIVHCCLGKSLLWQRSGEEALKEIGNYEIVVPSWSWMRYEGKICYADIPKVNTSWNRDIKLLIPASSDDLGQCILAASVARISQGCRIVPLPDTNCKIECAEGRAIGGIRFDYKKQVDIGRLGCIVIAQHKYNGWNEFSRESWEIFADNYWDVKLKSGNISYVLVVSCAARGQACGVVSQRLGVAVIQGEFLSFSEPPRHLWVF
jgi:hypothetical protein